MPRWLPRFVTRTWFLVTVGVLVVLFAAYTLAGFFLVPRLVRKHVPQYVQENLGRRAEIGEVRINPLLFKVEVKDFRLQEADGRPILGFDRLFVDFELSSLFRRAWTFAEISLDGPRLDAILQPNGRVNLADLADSFPKSAEPAQPEPEPGPPPRVLLEYVAVRKGVISFTDQTGRQPQTASIDPIDVELRNITTIPERRGPYTIAATLNGGGVLGWEGEVSLVPIRSTGRFGLEGFPLATAWRFIQEDVAVAQPGGTLDAQVNYQFSYQDRVASLQVDGLQTNVTGLSLTRRGEDAPMLALDKISLTGGRGDLAARELTIAEVAVTGGRIAATIAKDGTLNWQQIMAAPPAPGQAPGTAASSTPAAAAPAPAPPAPAAAPTAPSPAPATPTPAPAAPAPAQEARPWRVAIEKIRVERIALAYADLRPAAPVTGKVDDLAVALAAKLETGGAGGLAGTVENLDVALSGIGVARRGDPAPMLALERVHLGGARADLAAQEVSIPELSVSRGRLATAVLKDGTIDWQQIATPPASPTPAPAKPAPPAATAAAPTAAAKAPDAGARPWKLALGKTRVERLALALTDQSRATPVAVDVGDLTVDLSAKLESGAKGLAGVVEGLGVRIARVAVREAAAARGARPVVSLDQIALAGGRVDLGRQRVSASSIGVKGGTSTIVRAADGSLPLLAMLWPAGSAPVGTGAATPGHATGPAPAKAPAKAAPPKAASAKAAPAWAVALGRFDFANHTVSVVDQGLTPPVQLDLTDIKVTARDVRTNGKKPFPVDASLRIAQGGALTVKGRAMPDGSAAEAAVTLARLGLAVAQPYVDRYAAAELRSGEVSTAGQAAYRSTPDGPSITYTGTFDLAGLDVVEAGTGERVVAWKSLHADDLRFGLAPNRIQIADLRLTGLDGKLVIYQDKSVSIARLMKPAPGTAAPAGQETQPAAQPPAGTQPPAAAPPADAAPAAPAEPPFPVTIERVRIEDGSMHFADLSLVIPFATNIHSLNGVVAGVSTDPASRATVKMEGRVDEYGQMRVEGALNAYQPKVFTDLSVIFRNVPMTTLTPYSATFAGRRIASGVMNLDLQYKIDRGALLGENNVVLSRVKLGERVESPSATRLPLDLAIAILTDSDGRIIVDLPVRGNVDSPEFSYGRLIWQALVTVITKVASAPFRALGNLFGGDAEKMQAIVFEPGSAAVAPPEREKLEKVADALGKRPALKLIVYGGYDAKADGEALRSLRVRQQLAERLEVKLKPGEDPGPVAFDQVKTQRALEALLTQARGDKALDEFVAAYEKRTGKKADRANPVLAYVGRGAGDPAFYEALFRHLVEIAPLAETEVAELGRRRAEAIAGVLKERSADLAKRVEVGAPEAAGLEGKTIPSRLELGAVEG